MVCPDQSSVDPGVHLMSAPCSYPDLCSSGEKREGQPAPAKGKKRTRILNKLDKMCLPMGLTLKNKKGKLTDSLYAK